MMLGYDLHTSTVTHRLMAGPVNTVTHIPVIHETRNFFLSFTINHAVTKVVNALHHKSEGRGFDSRWCHWKFSLA